MSERKKSSASDAVSRSTMRLSKESAATATRRGSQVPFFQTAVSSAPVHRKRRGPEAASQRGSMKSYRRRAP